MLEREEEKKSPLLPCISEEKEQLFQPLSLVEAAWVFILIDGRCMCICSYVLHRFSDDNFPPCLLFGIATQQGKG